MSFLSAARGSSMLPWLRRAPTMFTQQRASFSRRASSFAPLCRAFSTAAAAKPAAPAASVAPGKKVGRPIQLTFVLRDGTEKMITAREGETLLEVSKNNNITEVEGACEGACACSTCHMIFEPAVFSKLGKVRDEENDMLDCAACVTDTSRLGCQVEVSSLLENQKIILPKETINMQG